MRNIDMQGAYFYTFLSTFFIWKNNRIFLFFLLFRTWIWSFLYTHQQAESTKAFLHEYKIWNERFYIWSCPIPLCVLFLAWKFGLDERITWNESHRMNESNIFLSFPLFFFGQRAIALDIWIHDFMWNWALLYYYYNFFYYSTHIAQQKSLSCHTSFGCARESSRRRTNERRRKPTTAAITETKNWLLESERSGWKPLSLFKFYSSFSPHRIDQFRCWKKWRATLPWQNCSQTIWIICEQHNKMCVTKRIHLYFSVFISQEAWHDRSICAQPPPVAAHGYSVYLFLNCFTQLKSHKFALTEVVCCAVLCCAAVRGIISHSSHWLRQAPSGKRARIEFCNVWMIQVAGVWEAEPIK